MDSSDEPTTVDDGATLDLGGFNLDLTNLLGGGTVTNSATSASLTSWRGEFFGHNLGRPVAHLHGRCNAVRP